ELDEIFAVIDQIGERGANVRRYFNREEKNAYALPPIGEQYFIETDDFGIRLYCVVLNEGVVFLLNGDRKKTLKATEPGSNVSRFFFMANSLHNELMNDKLQHIIEWNEKEIFFDEDYLINVQG
ncbi:MAG TPA: hypothetical protein VHB48_21200, partial [Chitinophagaceae bacterium]|nr:hypothetical protein [Chitinophagaceae bacterium]